MNLFILLSPFSVIALVALVTRKSSWALWSGALTAALVATYGQSLWLYDAFILLIKTAITETNIPSIFSFFRENSPLHIDHLFLFGFLLSLGSIISIINRSGSILAYTAWLSGKVANSQKAQRISILLSCSLFIDDYVSSLTVGAIMQPIMSAYGIAKTKFAFLLDALSAPLCVLIPVTSWVAFILAQLDAAGINQEQGTSDPLTAYCLSIGYLLYPIASIIAAWYFTHTKKAFGPMKIFENETTQGLNAINNFDTNDKKSTTSAKNAWRAITPIFFFLILYTVGMLYDGNWFTDPNSTLMSAFARANPFKMLFLSAFISALYALVINKYGITCVPAIVKDAWSIMRGSLLVLWSAWTFASLARHYLGIDTAMLAVLYYFGQTLFMIPAITFLTAATMTAATGSAWGTMGLLIPLIIPLWQQIPTLTASTLPLLHILIGALVSGAVAGGHISPLTDSMLMAATAANCPHFDHFISHSIYALPIIMCSIIGYIAIGIGFLYNISPAILIVMGNAVTIGGSLLVFAISARYSSK